MKRRITFFLAIMIAASACAQLRVGVFSGISHNHYSIDTQYQYDWRYGDVISEYPGISLQYDFCDWMGLRADFCPIAEKGYWKCRTGMFDKYSYDVYNRYLHFPVFSVFSFGWTRVRGYFGAGGFGAYWCESSRFGTVEDPVNPDVEVYFGENVEFNDERDNRIEAGPAAVAGIGYRFRCNLLLQLEGSLYYGVTSTTKDYMRISDPRYNTFSTVQLGLYYCF